MALRVFLGCVFAAVLLPPADARACTGTRPSCPICQSAVCTSDSWDCRNIGAGHACNDGDHCYTNERCDGAGSCVGTFVCAPADQCHTVSCNPGNGACSYPNKPDGTGCNDGNACTRTDTCQGGTCTGDNPVVCTALDQCHVAGTCDTSSGVCSNPAAANNTPCNDSNACTSGETCQNGSCGSPPSTVTCSALDQCHVAGTCNPADGTCSNPIKTNGSPCNDGNACTSGETCQNGACGWPSSTVVCTALDQCHVAGTCNPSTGACSNPNKADGTACDDGFACTTGESCQSGLCGSPVTNSCNWSYISYTYDQIGNLTSQLPGSCTPQSCATQGKNCGATTDGCGTALQCGSCAAGQVCLSSNVCCQPATCAALGMNCGNTSDQCGGTLSCGSCTGGYVCGGSNTCICPPGVICCPAGQVNCPNTTYCQNLNNDVSNCGSCGHVCPGSPNGGPVCPGGSCDLYCNSGYGTCGGTSCRLLPCP